MTDLFDDDVTPAEFEASRRRGLPVQIVTSPADYVAGLALARQAFAHVYGDTAPPTDDVIGLLAHHPYNEMSAGRWPQCSGGGYIAWVQVPGITPGARHQLVSAPGDAASLTVTPSLWHRAKDVADECGNSPHHGRHGFLRAGRWEVVG